MNQDPKDSGEFRPACAGLWSTPMVMVTGAVTTCCLDEHLVNELGSLKESSLNELWNGSQMQSWRLAQVAGEFSSSGPLCSSCNWRSAGSAGPVQLWVWLSQLERSSSSQKSPNGRVLGSARSIFFGLRRWWNIQCAR